MMPVAIPVTACGAAPSQVNVPISACNTAATKAGDTAINTATKAVTACAAATNQMIVPSSGCDATATEIVDADTEAAEQTEPPAACVLSTTPILERTPLRSAAALFQPMTTRKKEDTLAEEATPKTTVMLRNLPIGLNRSAMMEVLRSAGVVDHVVFIYLPMNLRSPGNFGYAFVDFDSEVAAEKCKDKLDGFSGWSEPDEKVLEIAWSETQGIDMHIQRYRDSPIMHPSLDDELKPAIFKNGVRIEFPPPTKAIRAPRVRKNDKRETRCIQADSATCPALCDS
jgi:hypothetical protein